MNKKLIALLFVAGLSAASSSISAGAADDALRNHFNNKIAQYEANVKRLNGYILAGEKLLTSGKVLSSYQLSETNKTIAKNRLRAQRQQKMIDQLRAKVASF